MLCALDRRVSLPRMVKSEESVTRALCSLVTYCVRLLLNPKDPELLKKVNQNYNLVF